MVQERYGSWQFTAFFTQTLLHAAYICQLLEFTVSHGPRSHLSKIGWKLRQYLSMVSHHAMEFMGCGCTYISTEDGHVFTQAMIAVDT